MRIVLCYQVESRHVQQIRQLASDCEVINAGQEGIAEEILKADIFVGHAKVPVPWDEVVRHGRLRWIQSSAAGLDHCLVPSVVSSDILVTSASGLFADQVSEQTMALLLALTRRLPVFFRAQQAKDFTRRATGDLHGKTVAIIGFGGNGHRLAQVLQPFRVKVIAVDQHDQPKPATIEALLPAERLDEALQVADVTILAVPLTPKTRGLFSAQRFLAMKKGSLLVNVARGQVVRETALIEALENGRLAGAGLDVTEVEPLPASSPLWEHPNVLITPHVGAQSAVRIDVATDFFCENFGRYQSGKRLLNLVDKKLGYPLPENRVPIPGTLT